MTARHYPLSLAAAPARPRTHPTYSKRSYAICPAKSIGPPELLHAFMPVIVGLAGPPPMADDRMIEAQRTPPRQEGQGDHPGSLLSFCSGNAIKRITAGVKGRR